ncbi:MAG: UDP-diphosphatase [Planctomycetaceae bacterium]|jgi:undecaprenyl-diphosphatase|nr:UDP-diphosphatase [Planctomycetaceae bacterium]
MEQPLWQIVILAIVQGLTEFLPISSSGHLVIVGEILAGWSGQRPPESLNLMIVLHLGTLMSILVFYARRIVHIISEDRRTIGLLIVGSIPAVIVGLSLNHYYEKLLDNPVLTGFMLLLTGVVLLTSARCRQGTGNYQQLTLWRALAVGVSQAASILPGISRSGTTICTGLGVGMTGESAATFSFLLAIPVIGGASLLKLKPIVFAAEPTTSVVNLLIGAAIAFAVGLVALRWLVSWLAKGRLWWFAPWCFVAGTAVLCWQLWP